MNEVTRADEDKNFSLQTDRVVLMFLTDMETHTPNPTERFTLLKDEVRLRLDAGGAMHPIARALGMLILAVLAFLISVLARRAEQGAGQQACRDDVSPELGRVGAAERFAAAGGDGCVDRRGDAGAPHAGASVAVRAALAAAGDTLVFDGATREDCIQDEGGARAARECRHLATMVRTMSALDDGHGVLELRFAKIALRTRLESCLFGSG